ncbi:MAG: polysaccharide biosynthesis tyrosine autokinase [Myxococcales bacterium]|nr:polysaccharide biosynthesis tyrosine autokinase [Myxococcota bacterium]MDW8280686.1 polysaccharide biosynthesis tyrosine autokinase [Myxococcales bacterium]
MIEPAVPQPAASSSPVRSGMATWPQGALGLYRPADSAGEIQHYLGLLLERRYIVIGFVVAGLLLAGLWTTTQPKIYEARAKIVVEAGPMRILGNEDSFDPTPSGYYMIQDYLQTSRQVLVSDSLARRAAVRLGLLKETGFFVGAPLPKTIEEAGEALLSHYRADHIAETRILMVTARHPNPAWAKRIADAVADEFVESNQQQRDTSTQSASQQLSGELEELRKRLYEAELALYDFKARHGLLSVSLQDQANQVARQIAKYTDALTEIRLRKRARQSQLEELQRLKQLDPLRVPMQEGAAPGLITDLRRVWAEEDRRLSELRERYQDTHPQVRQQAAKVQNALQNLRREVEAGQQAVQSQYNEAVREEQKVLADLEEVKREALKLDRLKIEYDKLKRDAESLQQHYTQVLNRTNQTGTVGRIRQNNVHVLDYARLPQTPVSPRIKVTLLVAGLLSLLLGVLVTLLLDAMDRSVKSQDDVEQRLMLPFLGVLPRLEGGAAAADLYVADHPRSTVAEACRTVRTNILFAGAERALRRILVTSSVAREGKTLCCISLGTVLAQGGARTLLVDCDLRRPRIARAFGLREGVGLTNVLLGDVDVQDAIRETRVPGLWILPSGPIPPNPAELLDGLHFRGLLEGLGGRFDRILIDSPPAVPVTDPAILSTAVDGVVLVVRYGQTGRDAVKRAAKHILDVGGRIVGVLLNDIDTRQKGYRGYYAGYYYQSEYITDDKHDRPEAEAPHEGRARRAG